jgi:DNA-binding NarL/FixJ family response regulator
MSYRIIIADDHELVRRGLRDLLADSGYSVVGEATNGREAVEMARQLRPDLAIIDVWMPGLDGIGATRQIRRELPGTEVLVLTMHEFAPILQDILNAGARGYLLKSDAGRELVAGIEAVRQHRLVFNPEVAEASLDKYPRLAASPDVPRHDGRTRLSSRESEILQLLGEGRSNKEVAAKLGISVKTVEAHRSRVMAKLGLRSAAELVHYAVRSGLAQP